MNQAWTSAGYQRAILHRQQATKLSRRPVARHRWRRLLFVLLPGVLSGCAGPQQVTEIPGGALVVVPNASEVRHTPEYDGAIHYVVDDPYPGEVTIAYIESAMRKAGWRASATSLLRLDRTDGGRTWWTYGKGPNTDVRQWDGGWSNDGGDLVTYLLRYEVSPRNAVARRMLVSAVYAKAATVEKLREGLSINLPSGRVWRRWTRPEKDRSSASTWPRCQRSRHSALGWPRTFGFDVREI